MWQICNSRVNKIFDKKLFYTYLITKAVEIECNQSKNEDT